MIDLFQIAPMRVRETGRPVELPRLHFEYTYSMYDIEWEAAEYAEATAGYSVWRPAVLGRHFMSGPEESMLYRWLNLWNCCLVWHSGALIMRLRHSYEDFQHKYRIKAGCEPNEIDAADAALVVAVYEQMRRYERGEDYQEEIVVDRH